MHLSTIYVQRAWHFIITPLYIVHFSDTHGVVEKLEWNAAVTSWIETKQDCGWQGRWTSVCQRWNLNRCINIHWKISTVYSILNTPN